VEVAEVLSDSARAQLERVPVADWSEDVEPTTASGSAPPMT